MCHLLVIVEPPGDPARRQGNMGIYRLSQTDGPADAHASVAYTGNECEANCRACDRIQHWGCKTSIVN